MKIKIKDHEFDYAEAKIIYDELNKIFGRKPEPDWMPKYPGPFDGWKTTGNPYNEPWGLPRIWV